MKWLVALGAIAILSIMTIQIYWIYNTWQLRETQFDQKVRAALIRVANNLAGLANRPLTTDNLIEQISTEYYVVNVNHSFEASDLEVSLKHHFESVLLKENFDYYVYDCDGDEMQYCNSIQYDSVQYPIQLVSAQKHRDVTYYFGVRFSGRTGFILGSMNLSIFFSVLMTLAIVFFAFAIYIIRKQKRLAELQADFINNMTHEFKTPISTIKISNEVFLNDLHVQQDPRLSNYAHIIQDQNDRLNTQVERVLQIARTDTQALELHREPLELHSLIEQTAATFVKKLEEVGGKLDLQLGARTDLIEGDRMHLQNILFNLIDNAIKYSPDEPVLVVQTESEGENICLRIRDQGIGIPAAYLPRIFDRFYRIPTGNVHNVKGFGLGLFYVKRICKAHGWHLEMDSEVGEGTEIRIYFS